MVGTAIAAVSVPFAVLASGGSVSDVGYVAAAGLLPTIAFLLFGGVLADRLPRQQVMVAANIGQALAQGGFALLVLLGEARLWEMMLLSAAARSGSTCRPRRDCSRRRWPRTSSLPPTPSGGWGFNGAQIGGAALGGVVVAAVGPGWGLVADAASYGIKGVREPELAAPSESTKPTVTGPATVASVRL